MQLLSRNGKFEIQKFQNFQKPHSVHTGPRVGPLGRSVGLTFSMFRLRGFDFTENEYQQEVLLACRHEVSSKSPVCISYN